MLIQSVRTLQEHHETPLVNDLPLIPISLFHKLFSLQLAAKQKDLFTKRLWTKSTLNDVSHPPTTTILSTLVSAFHRLLANGIDIISLRRQTSSPSISKSSKQSDGAVGLSSSFVVFFFHCFPFFLGMSPHTTSEDVKTPWADYRFQRQTFFT